MLVTIQLSQSSFVRDQEAIFPKLSTDLVKIFIVNLHQVAEVIITKTMHPVSKCDLVRRRTLNLRLVKNQSVDDENLARLVEGPHHRLD